LVLPCPTPSVQYKSQSGLFQRLAKFSTDREQNFRSGFVTSVLDGGQIAPAYSLGKIGPYQPSSLPSLRLLLKSQQTQFKGIT
jgi:hypothetical protein